MMVWRTRHAVVAMTFSFVTVHASGADAQRGRRRQVTESQQQAEAQERDAQALELYRAGETAFGAREYRSALELFRRSHALSGRPALLNNMGLCSDRLREDEDAIRYFEEYLIAIPDAPNREEVAARLRDLYAARERRVGVQDHEPTLEVAPITPLQAGGDNLAGWAVIVAGGVLAVGGVVLVGVALDRYSVVTDARDGDYWVDYQDTYALGQSLEIAGWTAIAVGAATAVVGVVLVATTGGRRTETALRIGPMGLSLEGSF